MIDETIILASTEAEDITGNAVDGAGADDGVRIYPYSRRLLALQVRTHDRLTHGASKVRHIVATALLNRQETLLLIELLQEGLEEIRP